MQHLEPCPNPKAGGYLALQVHHGLLKGLRWSPLVVTQNGNRSVGTVVGKDLRWDVIIRCKAKESGEQRGSAGLSSPSQHCPTTLQAHNHCRNDRAL